MATKRQQPAPARVLPAAVKPDPSAQPVACEVCGTSTTVGDSFSFVITFATTGPAHESIRIPSFQCEAQQHFACSQECAAKAAHACIDEHLIPAHALRHVQRVALAGQVRGATGAGTP